MSPTGPEFQVCEQRFFPALSLSRGVSKIRVGSRPARERGLCGGSARRGSRLPLQPSPWPGAAPPSPLPGQCEGQSRTISQALCGCALGKLGLCRESRTLPENWEIPNPSCSKSNNPLLLPGKIHSLLMAQNKVSFSHLWTSSVSYHSASSRSWEGKNRSHPAIAEKGWRSLWQQNSWAITGPLLFERPQSLKDEALSWK